MDLNRPRAKAISQMIMGMTNAQVNNQLTCINKKWCVKSIAGVMMFIDDGVHAGWAML